MREALDNEEIRQRFLQERQILAVLTHPGIARLLDGGVSESGRPYFVMEYVDGLPIDEYCDRHRLSVRARTRLFIEVCRAVHYAHQNLVVHRDLKPSNILVTGNGSGVGQVKLLDFGIAKLLNPTLSALPAAVTRAGVRVMTPEFAAPEQVRGEPVSTATDVYSLGVILYRLLTGVSPYGNARDLPAIEKAILEQAPERPSTAVSRALSESRPAGGSSERNGIQHCSANRHTTPERLCRRLRGDLDNIVLKALRKEPDRRYASALQFAEDLDRHLSRLPVQARPDSVTYRASMFVRRHAFGVAVTLGFVTLLGVFGTLYTVRVTAERDLAQLESAKATEVSQFLIDLFGVSDPRQALGREVTAREVLDRGAERIQRELGGQRELQANLMDVMGKGPDSRGAGPLRRSSRVLRAHDEQPGGEGRQGSCGNRHSQVQLRPRA